MARFRLIQGGGGDERPKSHGQAFQCDCPKNGCSCTEWGNWVPADHVIPQIVLCTNCKGGRHKD